MIAAEHMEALLGEDPFELVAEIEAAAKTAGKLRADANHAERVRKVRLAEIERAIRDAADRKLTVSEVEGGARASTAYREHLDWQRGLETEAAEAEATYYALRNKQDWLTLAAQALRAETYLAR